MPVRKDSAGNRSVEAEVIVPGTPEEVWQAIATGPGISSWFVPSTVEERVGGKAASNFGPGMESVGKISEWSPPHKYVVETPELGPEDPPVASEWTVEARDGGKCLVRVVHRWFTTRDDWDSQFEGHTHGWREFFKILDLYLTHFSGQPCSAFQAIGFAPEPKEAAWEAHATKLGFNDFVKGSRLQSSASAPPLAGVVEHCGELPHEELLMIRLDSPAPGIAHTFAMPLGGQVMLPVRIFLYGDRAAAIAGDYEYRWQAWMAEHFPPPAAGGMEPC